MKKMFKTTDIKVLDKYTIEREPISSIALMNRAALTVFNHIIREFSPRKALIIAGPGNNGGDGLVVADMLAITGWDVDVWSYTNSKELRSDDCQHYFDKLKENGRCTIIQDSVLPEQIEPDTLVIDALFGTGLSRPLEGKMADIVKTINSWHSLVISIDIPSGLGNEDTYASPHGDIICATQTISFQFPKLAFFLPETARYVGEWHITDIGLHHTAIEETTTDMLYIEKDDVEKMTKPLNKFAHKGDMGRAIIFAGSYSMMGAATLCAKACINSGVGVLTAVVPRCGYEIMQISVPEALCLCSDELSHSNWNDSLFNNNIKAIGIGPGLGRDTSTEIFVNDAINAYRNTPMVIDADALFHLSELIKKGFQIPHNAILTPHDGEFDRLTKHHSSRYERIKTAEIFANRHNVIIILKGAYTAIISPDGTKIFNTTGNAGMATGGSGDILTGIITAFLAQGYSPYEAATISVCRHGIAGDIAKEKWGERGVTAQRMLNVL